MWCILLISWVISTVLWVSVLAKPVDQNTTFPIPSSTITPNSSKFTTKLPDLVASINRSKDPCTDFYSFVCDGWRDGHPVPNTRKEVNQMQILEDRISKEVEEELRAIEYGKSRENDMAKLFYEKCLENVNNTSNESVKLMVDRIRFLRQNTRFLTDWLIEMNPTTAVMDVLVLPDDYNSTSNMISIAPSTPFLSFSAYFDPAYAEEYVAMRKSLFDFLTQLEEDDDTKDVLDYSYDGKWRKVEAFFAVDRALAKITQETEFASDAATFPVIELSSRLPSVEWMRYLSAIFPTELVPSLPERLVNVKQAVTVLRFEELISRLPPHWLADYLEWKVIFYYAPFMGTKYSKILEKYNHQVYGVERVDFKKGCVDLTIENFSDVLSSLWIEKYFDHSTIPKVMAMVDDVRESFLKLLETNPWMDPVTKDKARRKAFAIKPFVGFDYKQLTASKIQGDYTSLDFDENDSYYYISEAIDKWRQQLFFKTLAKTNSKENFEAKPMEANAFYDPSQNQIAILAGILREPYFNASWPVELNMAGIGMVIGHEITHGFDDYGAFFDEYGNRQNWWDPQTMKSFTQQRKCIEEQYDNITVIENVNINGRRTEGENIADNGGMRAIIRTVFSNKDMLKFNVDGLDEYSPQQIFFMTYGFTWCTNQRDHTLLTDLAGETHSPAKYRVNTVLSNQPEFSQAFSCPVGTEMNPSLKCTVW